MIEKPLLAWRGGKQRMAEMLIKMFPTQFSDYWEPFCGGCSVARNVPKSHDIYLGDANPYLINLYKVLVNPIEYTQFLYILQDLEGADYYQCREIFNSLQIGNVERAAVFFWMSYNCYRNSVRFNRKGEFNSSAAENQKSAPIDVNRIEKFAEWLEGVFIYEGDFSEAVPQEGDLVYCDPPYDGGCDNSYGFLVWQDEDTLRLAEQCAEWDKMGVYFIVSNADTDFIREVFHSFARTRVRAIRSIEAHCSTKTEVSEILIYNCGDFGHTIQKFQKLKSLPHN